MTGSKFERKGLKDLLAFMRPGDTVVIWKLDRLGRSLQDLNFKP
jgi:DNA invertase Pin-like site-specific DNA recombinase